MASMAVILIYPPVPAKRLGQVGKGRLYLLDPMLPPDTQLRFAAVVKIVWPPKPES